MRGSERGRTSNPRLRRPVLYPLSYGSKQPNKQQQMPNRFQRRERDSNPRYRESPIRRFSKPVPSATRPSLHGPMARRRSSYSVVILAEEEGFEPPETCASAVFKTAA